MKTFLLAAVMLIAACGTTDVMPPAVTPDAEDRFLIHPLTGVTLAPPASERFEAAYRHGMAGNEAEAERRIAELRQRHPELLVPTLLLEARLDLREGRFDDALETLQRVRENDPDNLVARVYEAEIAVRQKQTRIAYDLYRRLGDVPTSAERLTELEAAIFNELYAAAQTAPDPEAIRLLREALTFNTGAIEPRILLAQKLVTQRSFDEARTELEPLLNTAADRTEVQEILAEVDAGRGRYQEAIVRYDRLSRRTKDPRHVRRLEEIKSEWSAANMPSHYRAALESTALTRAELAVLLYWTVPSIRFAQNLSTPQIAIDVQDVTGREEIIRAIAIGLYDVDPVTRRVSPYRTISAARLATHLQRVLVLRGAPCARGISSDKVLSACGVADPLAAFPADATLTGRDALRYLQPLATKL
ncbi:MAG TPA: tetratricopeptide repeat protein [Thermoanaerobaculia bacterium]|nr:tetratricopeptide repeat protein [Thermoanaerobaculia bacterium]